MSTGAPLGPAFFERDPCEVAPELLGKILRHGEVAVRIDEVEAYRGHDDPASHAHRGPTERNRSMFGPGGRLYVYFIYGMHWCANVVCGPEGTAGAVLLRGGEPASGIEAIRRARPTARGDRDLCSGPAKLCSALGITGDHDGTDLTSGPVLLLDDGTEVPEYQCSPRIGISRATELQWRWVALRRDPRASRTPASRSRQRSGRSPS